MEDKKFEEFKPPFSNEPEEVKTPEIQVKQTMAFPQSEARPVASVKSDKISTNLDNGLELEDEGDVYLNNPDGIYNGKVMKINKTLSKGGNIMYVISIDTTDALYDETLYFVLSDSDGNKVENYNSNIARFQSIMRKFGVVFHNPHVDQQIIDKVINHPAKIRVETNISKKGNSFRNVSIEPA